MPGSISSLSTIEAPSVRFPWLGEKPDQELCQRHERILCPDGTPAEFDQPAIPTQHRIFGNPTPLGLLSWGYGLFLYSAAAFHTQGLHSAAAAVPALLFFGGVSQTLCAWWEMSLGNTYMGTIFGVFGAFSLSLGCLHLPAFGLAGTPDFDAGLGLFLLSFMMVFTLFLLGSLKVSLNVLSTLATSHMFLLLLGVYHVTGGTRDGLRIAAAVFGMLGTVTSWWTAITGLWTADVTFLKSPVVLLYNKPEESMV